MEENTSKLTQEQIDELVQRGKSQNGVLTYGDVMGTINSLDTVSSEEVEHLEKGLKALDKQIAQYRALKRNSDDLRENRELTAALIDRLIDRIEITKDKQITVRYRFESEFDSNEEALNRCKNM